MYESKESFEEAYESKESLFKGGLQGGGDSLNFATFVKLKSLRMATVCSVIIELGCTSF